MTYRIVTTLEFETRYWYLPFSIQHQIFWPFAHSATTAVLAIRSFFFCKVNVLTAGSQLATKNKTKHILINYCKSRKAILSYCPHLPFLPCSHCSASVCSPSSPQLCSSGPSDSAALNFTLYFTQISSQHSGLTSNSEMRALLISEIPLEVLFSVNYFSC